MWLVRGFTFGVVLSFGLFFALGCSSRAPEPEAVTNSEPSEETASADVGSEEGFDNSLLDQFDSSHFDDSAHIVDNEWMPLSPGTHWVYEGTTTEAGETIPHRIEFTVTDLVKEVAGVQTAVAWIADYADGELVEAEIAFYAQDKEGTVWYLGEYPEEYENGEFVKAPTWITGQEGAKAGVKMWAEPQLDSPSYPQGWGPAVEWSDRGLIAAMGQETCVPVDCYKDVMVIKEFTWDAPTALQVKYYARGVGDVRVGWEGDDQTQEVLELVEFTQLDEEALAEVRAEALALEEHAYEISQDVYGKTSPAEPLK